MIAYVDENKKSYKNWFYFTMDSGDNLSCSVSYAIIRLFAIDVCVEIIHKRLQFSLYMCKFQYVHLCQLRLAIDNNSNHYDWTMTFCGPYDAQKLNDFW